MPRCIPTGKPAAPNLHPLAQVPAMQAGATLEEFVEAGATYGRCITSQAERSCSPDTPMTKGRLRSPLDPIDQPYADWMHTIVVANGSLQRSFSLPTVLRPIPSLGILTNLLKISILGSLGSVTGQTAKSPGPAQNASPVPAHDLIV